MSIIKSGTDEYCLGGFQLTESPVVRALRQFPYVPINGIFTINEIWWWASVTISFSKTPCSWRDLTDRLKPTASTVPDFRWHSLLSTFFIANIFCRLDSLLWMYSTWPNVQVNPFSQDLRRLLNALCSSTMDHMRFLQYSSTPGATYLDCICV